jgi:alkaline phosphatase D
MANGNRNKTRRQFVVDASMTAASVAVVGAAPACGTPSTPPDDMTPKPTPFAYGVASGDPLTDRVMLWTHAQLPNSESPVALTWTVATDDRFETVVTKGTVEATLASGFTAKVDATGLQPGKTYFYRFEAEGNVFSPTGITRTLPGADAKQVKFAVFSCSLYAQGFFNAYDAAAKSDAEFAVHLGDFIYEYGSDAQSFGNTDAKTLGREHLPANDIVSIADYRTRHAQYRSDEMLQGLLAKMPLIAVWDDHEFANDAYVGGAQNHDTAKQGEWTARKQNAVKVYHEWMPIRTPDASNLFQIYRSFDFGSLCSLHMLETRIDARDRQYGGVGEPDGGIASYIKGITPDANGQVPDASRKLMSDKQVQWLKDRVAASTASWQILGNQDLMTKMWFPQSVLRPAAAREFLVALQAAQAFLAAKQVRAQMGEAALTPEQKALLDVTTNPRLPYNLDAWDGYPSARNALLTGLDALGKNVVVFSGDSHNGWFGNLTDGNKKTIAVEFGVPSVTSPGFDSVGLGEFGSFLDGTSMPGNAPGAGLGLIDDLGYADAKQRGFLLATITPAAVQGEYVYVSTIKSKTYTTAIGRTITKPVQGAVTFK